MNTNPFDSDDNTRFMVLANDAHQHSLWPVTLQVPAGWQVVYGDEPRSRCLDFIAAHWTDLDPRS